MSLDILFQLDNAALALIIVGALITSVIHGATGVAGGMLMAAVLATVIGVKPVVPVMSVAMLISHSSRALINFRSIDRSVFFLISAVSLPALLLVSSYYGQMSSSWIAILLGTLLVLSVPLRHWGMKREQYTTKSGLAAAAVLYGGLSGAAVGPGMVLSPFMLSYGMKREAFVATMAVIALTTNVFRVGVYGGTAQLDSSYMVLGVFIGLLTIPGNWVGRSALRSMSNQSHSRLVDVITVLAALNFFYLALDF